MDELKLEIKKLLIDCLELEDISVSDIGDSDPLFGDGLGLDSIDALELGLAVQKKFAVKLDAESEETRQHFRCVESLAAFVAGQRA